MIPLTIKNSAATKFVTFYAMLMATVILYHEINKKVLLN